MRNKANLKTWRFKFLYLGICLLFVAVIGNRVQGQNQATKFTTKTEPTETQSIYREYRSIRIGMTMEETRAKLGEPVFKSDDQDVFVFSASETTQIVYNKQGKVVTISTDYLGGVGAPDYRTVVGSELETRPNGSKYKMVRYENVGFWVSYNQTGAAVPMITVTIQAIR